ncbi:MAG: hypothetical protein ACJ8BF_15475 [Gemmatimonadales bacterium]
MSNARHTEAPAAGIGGFASAGGQRRDLEVIRERLQGGDVRLCRPAAIGIGADDADTNSLRPFLLMMVTAAGQEALLNM